MPATIPGPGQPIFPGPDADCSSWMQAFAPVWNPATFNVVLPTTIALADASVEFGSALGLASASATRSPVTVAAKDAARADAENVFRGAVRSAVAAFRAGTATSAQLSALGVRTPDLIPTPIPAPAYAPLLGLVGARPGFVDLRVTQVVDGVAVDTRKFPQGITGLEISRNTGSGWALVGIRRRVNLAVSTSDLANGLVVGYRVRYCTGRGLTGPWSDSVNAATMVGS